MADVAHTIPASVTVLEGSVFGYDQRGLEVTRFATGPSKSRDWVGHNFRWYELRPSLFVSGDGVLGEWEVFAHQTRWAGNIGWVLEPISEDHRELICGPLGDASRTTFPIPVLAPSSVTPLIDNLPQESADYTVHAASNLLVDEEATVIGPGFEDLQFSAIASATLALESGTSLDGLTCLKITPPDGSTANVGARSNAYTSGIAVDDELGVTASVIGAGTFQVIVYFYTSVNGYISEHAAVTSASLDGTGWVTMHGTYTVPATAAKFRVGVRRSNISAVPFYADCFGGGVGDYDVWHLPSQCPGTIEFGSAPAADERITASATGKRLTRCQLTPGFRWTRLGRGHAQVRSVRAVEAPEF